MIMTLHDITLDYMDYMPLHAEQDANGAADDAGISKIE
jgi:hypothetical protein